MRSPAVRLPLALSLWAFIGAASAEATLTLSLDVTVDRLSADATTQVPLPADALLLWYALGADGVHNGLGEASFTLGDDLLLAATSLEGMNYDPGAPAGQLWGGITIPGLDPAGLGASRLALVWVPSLTFAAFDPLSPLALGTAYGVTTGSTLEFFDDWVIPAEVEDLDWPLENVSLILAPVVTETNGFFSAESWPEQPMAPVPDAALFASHTVGSFVISEPAALPALALLSSMAVVRLRRLRR